MPGTISQREQLMVASELYDKYKGLIAKEFFDTALFNLRRAEGRPSHRRMLEALYDLLDRCKVTYKKDQSYDYYRQLVDRLYKSGVILPHLELVNKMLAEFFKASVHSLPPEVYLNRLVDRLSNFRWGNDSLRLKILKQFITEGNALAYKRRTESGKLQTVHIYNGDNYLKNYVKSKLNAKVVTQRDLIDQIDDGVFDVLKGASKEDMKPDGKYGILKMINDLSLGLFRKGGNTKRALYLFAIVFHMTFYPGIENAENQRNGLSARYEDDTDIEMNLFVDYYCNNIIRFMQESYDDVQLMQVETDPSGQGINYKNYAEIIYLYYLSRPGLQPFEKLCASNEMLLEIEYLQKNDSREIGNNDTVFFRQNVRGTESNHQSIFSMSEKQLLDFIRLNYHCDRGQRGFMQLATEQNTAFRIYRELRRRLAVLLKFQEEFLFHDAAVTLTDEETDRYLKNCREGLWFCDPVWCNENIDAMRDIIAPYVCPEIYPRETYERFARMLICCQNILGGSGFPSRLLFIDSPDLVTRSALLTTYYYYFNARQALFGDMEDMSFEEVFNTFSGSVPVESLSGSAPAASGEAGSEKMTLDMLRTDPSRMNPDDGVNTLLSAAYYQPISGKNILDVMIIFSSYTVSKV